MKISRRELIKIITPFMSSKISFAKDIYLTKNENQIYIPILMYHDINPFKKDLYTVSPSQFASQMEFLYINGYSPIFPSQLENMEFIKNIKKPIIITFDDAYASILEYGFPYLEYYNFKFVINVIGEYVGKYINFENFNRPVLSWDELNYLLDSGLCEIGYHGYSIHIHNWINKIDLSSFEKDIDIFYEKIRKYLNIDRIDILAFPYGQYREIFIKSAVKKGFRYLMSSDEGILKVNLIENPEFMLIPRLNVDYRLDLLSFKEYIGGSGL